MVSFKLVIGTKEGKCFQHDLKEELSPALIGKKIGDKVKGDEISLPGYEFQITGGSDHCGFPMRKDVDGPMRKRILAVQGVGVKKRGKGLRQKKTVGGNTIHDKTAQINLKVVIAGSDPLPHVPQKKS